MPVTIRDVAAAAGVSAMSVSKVLHGKGQNVRVSAATAENIRRIAKELDYRPNLLARSFRQQRTRTLGLVFPHIPELDGLQTYHTSILQGAVTAAFGRDYSITICPRLVGDEAHRSMDDGRFDGLLWCRNLTDMAAQARVEQMRVPVVLLHAPIDSDGNRIPCVQWDNVGASQLAVEHLHRLGHRRLAFVTVDRQYEFLESVKRYEGFRDACARLGIPPDDDLLVVDTEGSGFAEWWASQPAATALVVWNDSLAARIVEQAQALGVSVPGELSVVSFDSTIQAKITDPSLTAVFQPLQEMAECAVNMLVDRIENPERPVESRIYPGRLDVRHSTGIPNR